MTLSCSRSFSFHSGKLTAKALKFVREFSELAPRLEEGISKMCGFDSEILRLENTMKSWQETAMQEIQKREDHLDFLTSQAEEFQRQNAELREKMNIIENILVTRAAETAAAQAASAVLTAATASSLEPAAPAAQNCCEHWGKSQRGTGPESPRSWSKIFLKIPHVRGMV